MSPLDGLTPLTSHTHSLAIVVPQLKPGVNKGAELGPRVDGNEVDNSASSDDLLPTLPMDFMDFIYKIQSGKTAGSKPVPNALDGLDFHINRSIFILLKLT